MAAGVGFLLAGEKSLVWGTPLGLGRKMGNTQVPTKFGQMKKMPAGKVLSQAANLSYRKLVPRTTI